MKIFTEILTLVYIIHLKKWIFDGLSGTFRFDPRMFLVCFSFSLRSNFAPDRFIPRIFLVRRIFKSNDEVIPDKENRDFAKSAQEVI